METPRICTMTIFIKSNLKYINIGDMDEDKIRGILNDSVIINKNKSFYNSVTIRYKDTETRKGRAIKVFRNGNLHVTGYTRVEDAEATGGQILGMFEGYERMEEVKIQMMNTCFRIDTEFNMMELFEEFRQSQHIIKYDTERHAGLQIKMVCGDRKITVIVFRTGSVLITGVRSMEELEYGHREIMRMLSPKIEPVMEPVSKRQKIDKTFDYGMFL